MGMTTTGNSELMRRDGTDLAAVDHGSSRSDAMGMEVGRLAETGTAQLEAQARALIQARFFLAKQPNMQRSWDQVEQKLRKECARPGFANSAWWVLPLGNDAKKYPEGLSIRFAEAALRICGNIDIQQQTVFDDDWKRILRVTAMDLESNFAYTAEVSIDKTVERKNPNGREVLTVRQNSSGGMTYVVAATEQELALKQGSAVSKAIRTQGLRLIPGDILDECKKVIKAVRLKGAQAEDPEQARKALLDNFAEIGVMPAHLAQYVGHDTDIFQPAERDELRGLFRAIRDGHATWKDVMETRHPQDGVEKSAGAKKVEELLKQKAAPKTAPKSADEPTATQSAPPSDKQEPALASAPKSSGRTAPAPPSQEMRTFQANDTEKPLPDPFNEKVGSEAYYIEAGVKKIIRVVDEPGDGPKWVVVEEVQDAAAPKAAAKDGKKGGMF